MTTDELARALRDLEPGKYLVRDLHKRYVTEARRSGWETDPSVYQLGHALQSMGCGKCTMPVAEFGGSHRTARFINVERLRRNWPRLDWGPSELTVKCQPGSSDGMSLPRERIGM